MKLHELVDPSDLTRCLSEKLIGMKKHPTEDLYIYNYTQRAQFTPDWTPTMELCRGLIVDGAGDVVARGFRKFWNYNDSRHPETQPENLPPYPGVITEKYDGSLGIGYLVNGKLRIATRGSFTSEQAMWANRWVRDHDIEDRWDSQLLPVFEIVYPENRIVINYDFSGLVLLALIDPHAGTEASLLQAQTVAYQRRLRCVGRIDSRVSLSALLEDDRENEEGYVVTWSRLGTTPLRVKIKLATYCLLHKLYTQCSIGTIWEALSEGRDGEDQIQNGTEAFKAWFYAEREKLQTAFDRRFKQAQAEYRTAPMPETDEDPRLFRKRFAEWAMLYGQTAGLMFALLDGKDITPMIWKMIKPSGVQPVFKPEQAE